LNTHIATEAARGGTRRTFRTFAVNLTGPATMLGGVVWAFLQPYRLTILHPHGEGFWWLFSEPPLYVVLVGLGFAVIVAPGLLEDLDEAEDATTR
jgi:hypothetical protein